MFASIQDIGEEGGWGTVGARVVVCIALWVHSFGKPSLFGDGVCRSLLIKLAATLPRTPLLSLSLSLRVIFVFFGCLLVEGNTVQVEGCP